ncbi:MAG TPA: cystathionine beta-lyase [Firmicutes bacterium]|jgi:cystathionine beta-lyase|nr:cystathionine beta-lyase [Bacillota bacterium]
MKYDFDQPLNRYHTDSVKWDGAASVFGSDDLLPMWVADMDFPVAAPILKALHQRIDHGVFGYTIAGAGVRQAVIDRMQNKYGWKVQPEWLIFTPGVVSGLSFAVKAYTKVGDHVVIQSPVYFPFMDVAVNNGCQIANSPLRLNGARYEMDFDSLQQAFEPQDGKTARSSLYILCSPHNPVGRVWSKDELMRAGRIAIDHGAIVIADEIHGELIFEGRQHVPFAGISEEFEQNSVVFIAPSKTFNLAGLAASVAIIANEKLRQQFQLAASGFMGGVNTLGLTALEAAFREGDEWLTQLLDYLHGNVRFTLDFLAQRIPEVKAVEPEGTYLMWLDCTGLGMDIRSLRDWMRHQVKLGLNDGYMFGPGGEGHQRLNIACPRALLREALGRLEQAVSCLR